MDDIQHKLNALLKKQDFDGALQYLESQKEQIDTPEWRYLQSSILYQQQHTGIAKNLLKKNIEEYPEHAKSYLNYSVILWQDENKENALSYAKKARNINTNDIEAHINVIDMCMALNDKDQALEAILYALEFFEGYPAGLKLAATIYMEREEWIKAKYYIDLLDVYTEDHSNEINALRSLLPT